MTGTERDKLNVIERRIDVMQRDIEHALGKMKDMEARQVSMDNKMDVLVDRVADNRLESYKSGMIAAAVSAVVAALGGRVQ